MTGIIQSKKGDAERCTEIRSISVPNLWHIAHEYPDGTLHKAVILECWHLAHDMKTVLVALDKVIPLMLQRATERIKELITDIQEMGDIERLTVTNLKNWAEELSDYTGLFEYLPMGGDFMGSERNEAEHYIALALQLAEEIEGEIDEPDPQYACTYDCSCGHQWVRTWSCACNDKCPNCNLEIEPTISEEMHK